ncbi:hypothetical protein CcI49_17075 [Frankia sp. CcI49]|uniref:hypothetical protein n=1 Tax=Frankia sp. CcI49 TaxID=1745382 RepID=UPI000976E81D|nr:hypothetical protein [Frankia sp. CcI49]ONH59654.1 hypothetical protein CcI49_17075 [Frankia sp. CcI49]
MKALIPASELEPTAGDMARARAHFADCGEYSALRSELAAVTVHSENLAQALAIGNRWMAAAYVRTLVAHRRVYDALCAELDIEHGATLAATTAQTGGAW